MCRALPKADPIWCLQVHGERMIVGGGHVDYGIVQIWDSHKLAHTLSDHTGNQFFKYKIGDII